MNTNYFGVVRCTKQILPAMRERRSGCIINVSSIAGRIVFPASGAYAASKFALEALSEALAQEGRAHGIRVALVEPGIIDTPMATTSLPPYTKDTIYPQGRRVHAFFHHASQEPSPPMRVAEKIKQVIEIPEERLRFPVGPDALPLLGWRQSVSDEYWIKLGAGSDSEYYERVFADTGIDLRS